MAADRPVIAVRTLGCKVNRTESEALAEALAGPCAVVMDTDAGAGIVVVNTCTVTAEADAKARKAVRHALAQGAAAVVVTGCLASVDPESLRSLDPRVVVEADRGALVRRVAELAGVRVEAPAARPDRPATLGRLRVMVKIQDGCDHRCSYCIVPDARGPARSVATREVIERVSTLALAGAHEVVLTGVNIGRYTDPEGASDLAELVDRICETPIERVRISSIEPLHLDGRLMRRMAGSRKVVPHLHVPLQSGCDRTLEAMGRGYDTRTFAAVLSEARAALPGLAVTTDVMTGFPGESDADFAESLAFVESCAFARLHVFRYSARPGTPAADRADQVPPAIRSARATDMRALSSRLESDYVRGRIGQGADIVVERVVNGVAEGTSEDHLRVVFEATAAAGDVVRVVLTDAVDGVATGVVSPAP